MNLQWRRVLAALAASVFLAPASARDVRVAVLRDGEGGRPVFSRRRHRTCHRRDRRARHPDTGARGQALCGRLVAGWRGRGAGARAHGSRRRCGHHAGHPDFAAGGATRQAAQAGDRAAGHRSDPAELPPGRGSQRPPQFRLRRGFPERGERAAHFPPDHRLQASGGAGRCLVAAGAAATCQQGRRTGQDPGRTYQHRARR